NGRVLGAKGVVLDEIKSVGVAFKQKRDPRVVGPALEAFHDWWDLFTASFPECSLAAQTAFGRAISCGNWMFEEDSIYERMLWVMYEHPAEDLVDTPFLERELLEGFEQEFISGKEQQAVVINVAMTMNRRRFFVSKSGMLGLAPWNAVEGDLLCVLLGCRFPVVLRRVEGGYILVGEVYVDGFMDGEALEEGRFEVETFEIH
ncbi:hypothetical protein LSUE1_G007190, partial [Lachnellula suecica]